MFTKKLFLILNLLFIIYNSSHAQGVWTWMSGDTSISSFGVYGTQGIPSSNNLPPNIYSPFCWTDLQGNFWLYGGYSSFNNGAGASSDLWKFNPITLEWTWVNGTGTSNANAVYGTKGIASSLNTPGGRYYSGCTWADTSGDLWLYGGANMQGIFADLWKYNISSNEWTWMSGSNLLNQVPIYGTMSVPSLLNNPGSRDEIGSPWLDSKGKFWLYGGNGPNNSISYSDMWMYDLITNMWTWESGSQYINVTPVYGTKGFFSLNNTPGGRLPYAMITEKSGNFLLFGGCGIKGTPVYADLWEYNPVLNQWAWVNGSQSVNVIGVSGISCQNDSTFYPDARFENRAVWKDCAGNFWMYGGHINSNINNYNNIFGDVWVYISDAKQWARMSDSSYTNKNPVYGTLRVPSLSNQPGGTDGSAHWKDNKGNFWMLGGMSALGQSYNNMWRYIPDSICVKSKCSCVAFNGAITSSQDTICEGSGLKSILSLNDSTGNLQWQSSTDSIHFSNLGDTSSTYTTPPSLSQTTFYRIFVNNNCGADSSNIVPVHILADPVAKFTDTIKGMQVIFNSDSSSSDVTSFSWNFGDSSISNIPNPTHTFTRLDTFTVCLTVYNGSNCSYTLCKDVDLLGLATGINSVSTTSSIQLYPNPASNKLLVIGYPLLGNKIEVTDLLGRVLITQMVSSSSTQQTIDVSKLVDGFYFITVKNMDGVLGVKKFVKE